MKPAPFAYHRPTAVDEAVGLLADTHGKVLAGGQSLVPLMSMRLASPSALVDVNGVAGLDRIEVGPEAVWVGATVRHAEVERHAGVAAANSLLPETLATVAHPTIRNRGTVVGSLAHADPAAELPAVLMLLGGSVSAVGPAGERTIDASDLYVGPLETSLADDELVTGAGFPHPPTGSGTAWLEVSRRHGDFALVGVGALVGLDRAGCIERASVALVSVGPTPVLVDVTTACAGSAYDAVDWTKAEAAVDAAIEPEDDIHATADYRRQLARVLTRRALGLAVDRAAAQRREGAA